MAPGMVGGELGLGLVVGLVGGLVLGVSAVFMAGHRREGRSVTPGNIWQTTSPRLWSELLGGDGQHGGGVQVGLLGREGGSELDDEGDARLRLVAGE